MKNFYIKCVSCEKEYIRYELPKEKYVSEDGFIVCEDCIDTCCIEMETTINDWVTRT